MVPGGRSAAAVAIRVTASLPASAAGFQHHHAFVGEQRRAQQFGELAGADLPRAHAIDRDVVGAGLLASRPQDRGDRALDKQLFVPEHQM